MLIQIKRIALGLLAGMVFFSVQATAETLFGVELPDNYVMDVQDKELPKEGQLDLPAFPKQENLIPFDVSESFGFKFYIDSQSLSVGKDAIFRYTVVLLSKEGAITIYYEGLRCSTKEFKRFAESFSESQGKWLTSRNQDWVGVTSLGRNNYRFALFNDYWCSASSPIFSVKDMIRSLTRGGYGVSDTLYDKSY